MKKAMYVSRNVLNGKDILDWAKDQGFTKSLTSNDLHVTIAYSKKPVEFDLVQAQRNKIKISKGKREVKTFDGGATVLKFESKVLTQRWNELCDAGCSWDYDEYQPHVTITFEGQGIDSSGIMPYEGVIELGPEIVAELDENWSDGKEERNV